MSKNITESYLDLLQQDVEELLSSEQIVVNNKNNESDHEQEYIKLRKQEDSLLDIDDNAVSIDIHDESETYAILSDIERTKQSPTKNTKTFMIELPREMLTAYILLHVKGDWIKFKWYGKIGIFLSFMLPFMIQITVAIVLMMDVRAEDMKINLGQHELIYDLLAITVLFIYMYKDLAGLIRSTWYFLGKIEESEGGYLKLINDSSFTLTRISSDLSISETIHETIDNLKEFDIDEEATKLIHFTEFRIEIICVFLLYGCLTLYAIISINKSDDIAEKLEVAISIFFVLEVDDWAYQLFVGQSGLLDDSQFNIEVPWHKHDKNEDEQRVKNQIKVILSLVLVLVSVSFVVIWSTWL